MSDAERRHENVTALTLIRTMTSNIVNVHDMTYREITRRFYGVCGLLSLLLAILFTGCSSEPEPEPEPDEGFLVHYEILEKLFHELPQATREIRFGDVPEFAPFLLKGWSGPEEGQRWAGAETAELAFYHTGVETDLDLEIHWAALPSANKEKQTADILLNGAQIKSVQVETSFKTQKLRLEASKLLPGLNVLTFRFAYTERPAALDPNSQDERDLAVAFQWVRFSAEKDEEPVLQALERQEFFQKTDSAIGSFLKFPARFALDVEYQSAEGTDASIEIADEHGKVWKLSLPSGNTAATKVFSLPQKGVYRFHAVCRGPEDGGLVWKNIRIRTKTEQAHLGKAEEGFVKASSATDTEKPDILLYVIDTLRADHVGSYGYERNTTPEIDAFAAENARYQNAYSTASWTKPSGASLLSGLLPRNHQATTRTAKVPDDVVMLGEILQDHGYYTAAFVTNGALADNFGFEQGFDQFIKFPENFKSVKIHARAAAVNKKVFAFLDQYTQNPERKPLFLLFWSTEPHDPYTPPEEFQGLFEIERFTPIETPLKLLSNIRHKGLEPTASQIEFIKTRYDQEIFSNDHAFGALVERLKSLKLYDDMMLILASDHGEEFFDHGSVGHGLTLYNEQIRIPLIVKSPDIAPGLYEAPVQLIDIYPTILDALHIEAPYTLDGISLLDFGAGHSALYFEQELAGNDLTARLDNDKKIILNRQYFRPPLSPVMPSLEVYAANDAEEQERLELEGLEDYYRLQELTYYSTTPGGLGFQQSETELSPELNQKLRDLGYTK